MITHWPDFLSHQCSRQAIVTILVRGPNRSTWFNGVVTNLFCKGLRKLIEILDSGVQLRTEKVLAPPRHPFEDSTN